MAIRSGHSRSSRLVSAGNPYHREVQQPTNNLGDGCRLYIGNLSWDVKWQDLKDYFATVGRVVRADVEEENGKSKGWGIVEYSTPEEAAEAMTRLNDTDLMGRPVHVREDREAGGRSGANRVVERGDRMAPGSARSRPSATGCKVYVGNLSWEVKWQHLKDFFKTVGFVVKADVLEEPDTGRSKGCGIVEFSSPLDAQRAINQLNDTPLLGRMIFVREDREEGDSRGFDRGNGMDRGNSHRHVQMPSNNQGQPNALGCRIYVGNLSWEVKWQDLKDLFKSCGTVVRADVMEEPGGRSKGCGLVEFSSPIEAQRAMLELNDTEFMGRQVFIREDREEGGGGGGGDRGGRSMGNPMQQNRNHHQQHHSHHAQTQYLHSQQHSGAVQMQSNSYDRAERPPRTTQTVAPGEGKKIYVGNLSWDVKWQDLKDLFKSCGTVVRADVMEEPGGRSKGCGIVEFSTPQEAQQAMADLNDTEFMGRQVFIREDREEGVGGGGGGGGAGVAGGGGVGLAMVMAPR